MLIIWGVPWIFCTTIVEALHATSRLSLLMIDIFGITSNTMCLLSSSFCFLSVMFVERALSLTPHLLFLPWRKKVSKKGQDCGHWAVSKCARLTRKTYVQKAEIVQTHSAAMRRSSNSGRFLIAFHTCFSALRSRSVGRVFYLHLTDYELGIILQHLFLHIIYHNFQP